jgi:hypothetical protein
MSVMTDKKVGQEFAIEELVKTVSGDAVIKRLDAKKQRYANSINQAIEKNKDMLAEKRIDAEPLRNHLLVLVDAILAKSRFVGEFFKFNVRVEQPKKTEPPKVEKTDGQVASDQIKMIDSLFNG